jgi:hypothetical protein
MKKILILSLIIINISILKMYSQSLCPLNTNISPSTPICSGSSATLNVSQVSATLPSNALNFNGTSAYASTTNFIAALPTSGVTIELWFKAASAGVIVDEMGGAGAWHNSQIEILSTGEVKIGVSNVTPVSLGTVAFNTWNHVALRYNNVTSRLDGFLNGVLSSTFTTGVRNRSGAAYYAFGKSDATNLGSGAWLNGSIDEVRIWDFARTQSQITVNYNQTIAANTPGLAAYYQFDESSGFTSADATINARTLTLVSSPTWQVPSTAPIWSSSIGSNYTWSTGATTSSIVVTPSVTTSYSVVGASPTGCVSSNVIVVTVNPTPTISINSGSICAGNSFTISPTGASTYTYSSGSNIVSPLSNSSYTVNGTTALGCTNTAVSSVTVNITPTVSVNSGSICNGSSFVLLPNGATTYVYSSGSATVAPTLSSTFSVTGTNTLGCSSTAVSNITVSPFPLLSISGSSAVCPGNSSTLSALSSTLPGASNAVVLDGVDDYLSTNISGTTLSAFTIEAFIKPDALPQASKGIIQWATNLNDPAPLALFQQNASALNIYVNTGYNLTVPLALNSWNHVALTYSSSVYRLYLNGALVVTYNGGVTNQANANKIFLGNGYIGYWKGAIDEVRVWNVARSQPQIASNYNVSISPISTGLMAYYKFNESSGVTSANNVAAVNTFTLSNGPTWQIPSTAPVLSNTVSASSYAWSTGASSSSITITPTITTTYSVVGTSALGCSGTSSVFTVTINPIPPVSVNSGSICNGSSFTMIPSGASSYIYSSGSSVVSPTSNSSYTVTGTSALGCTNTAVSSVTVDAGPIVSVNSGTICNGDSFVMLPSGASSYAYTGGSATVSPTTNTGYTVTGTSALGCTNTAVSNVTVNPIPTLAVSSGSICSGSSFTFVPTGAISYTYSSGSAIVSPSVTTDYTVTGSNAFGCNANSVQTITVSITPVINVSSGAVCTGGSWTITPTGAVTYTYSSGSAVVTPTTAITDYTVSGSNIDGCESMAVITITVNPTLLFSPNSGSVCLGSTFTMSPTGAVSYTYSSGTAIVTPTASTTYTILAENSVGCLGEDYCTVTVNALPTVTAASDFTLICVGEVATLNAGGASTYVWNTSATTASISVTPTTTTTYSVDGTDVNGCVNSANVTVNVNDCVGIQQLSSAQLNINVYPNPTTGLVTLDLNAATQITITNALGQVVYTETVLAGKQTINLKNQNNGLYFMNLNQHGKQQTIKVIKN